MQNHARDLQTFAVPGPNDWVLEGIYVWKAADNIKWKALFTVAGHTDRIV